MNRRQYRVGPEKQRNQGESAAGAKDTNPERHPQRDQTRAGAVKPATVTHHRHISDDAIPPMQARRVVHLWQ